jgi:dihydrofolate reductase
MVILIVAAAENNAMGKNNDLPWHLPDDFKRFKSLTVGHPIIMGRKTFESLPGMLPNREHIIISRSTDYKQEGCIVVESLEKALQIVPENEDAFVIGGGEIFRLAMPVADVIEMTRVHANVEGDTFFPKIDPAHWELSSSEFHPKDERHNFAFTFETYKRK